MSSKPKWKQPTVAQILSDRTVFRFQQIANLLQSDLDTLPGFAGNLDLVLFVQRDAHHSSDRTRYYNASLCGTSSLVEVLQKELKLALNNKNGSCVNRKELTLLFSTYDRIAGKNGSFTSFQTFVETNDWEEAHELLVEAASATSYKGELPTAFDQASHPPKAHWFYHDGGRWKSRTAERDQLAFSSKSKPLNMVIAANSNR